jgi:hypothetical protein
MGAIVIADIDPKSIANRPEGINQEGILRKH